MPRVTVDSDALNKFIVYADEQRYRGDSQFLASKTEYETSQREFDNLIASLSITLADKNG